MKTVGKVTWIACNQFPRSDANTGFDSAVKCVFPSPSSFQRAKRVYVMQNLPPGAPSPIAAKQRHERQCKNLCAWMPW